MGVAGSKASELDAVEERPATRMPSSFPVTASHNSRGLKRRHTDETVLGGAKKRKAAKGAHHIDLVFRSPKPGHTRLGRTEHEGVASGSPQANVSADRGLILPAEQSQIGDNDPSLPRNTTSGRVAAPPFNHVIRSLREESEELPSGWAVAEAPLISQSQRDHNLTMVRRAVASLKDVHLTDTYSKGSFQLSSTFIPAQDASNRNRPRLSRRASVQTPGLPRLHRRSRIFHRPASLSLGVVATKRPLADEYSAGQYYKHVRRNTAGSMHRRSATGHVRKLHCLWRNDDWSGWSGLLQTEY